MIERCNASFADIGRVVNSHQRFAVVGHVRPDGDAIGSQLALGIVLTALGKEVAVINQDRLPGTLSFLPGGERLQTAPEAPRDAEVVFALDTASRQRLGEEVIEALAGERLWINIDHHISNPGYGDLCHIDPAAPATGQILYRLFRDQEWPVCADAAVNLYAAISTDTGSFQYPGTTDETLRTAADLVTAGVDVGEVSQQLYQTYPYRRLEAMRELLNHSQMSDDGRVISWSLSRAAVQRLGLRPEDCEGLIDVIRSVDTVVVAVFFEELVDNKVRISARSKSDAVDVCRICGFFNGGGHVRAAGARVRGALPEVEDRFLTCVKNALKGQH